MDRPWYETRLVRLHLDMHTPEWFPGVFDNVDIDDLVKTYKEAGIEAVTFGAKGCYGNCYYDTHTGHKHDQLGDRDFLGEFVAKAHAVDIKVLTYYLACWDTYVATKYPDWQVRNSKGEAATVPPSAWQHLCPNSPYREYMLRQTEEIVAKYPIDAMMYDMVMAGTPNRDLHCYCEYCQRKFRAQFGKNIPTVEGEDPLWWEFVEWRYQCIEQFLREARALVKRVRPECVFTINHLGWPYIRYDMGNRAEEPVEYLDFVMSEAYSQVWGITCPSLFPRFSRGISGGKPVHTFSYSFVDQWDFERKSPLHLAYEMYTAAANGSSVCYIDQWYPGGGFEKEAYIEAKPVFDEVKARRDVIVGAEPLTHAGLLYSIKSRDLYAKSSPCKYVKAMVGVDKMMTELQQNCEIVPDGRMTPDSLSRFSVILATNTVSLSDDAAHALREYVANGGGLVASYLTSLWDEKGVARPNFALADVFGVDFRSIYPYSVPFFWPTEGSPIAKALRQKPYIARAADSAVIETREGAEVVATLVEPVSERSMKYTARWYSNCGHMPPGRRTDTPFIVANKFGKGRVVYFCWNIGDAYAGFGYRHERQLVEGAVKWVSSKEPLLQVLGPMTLESTYWRQGKRLICHIISPHFQKACGWMDLDGGNQVGFVTAEEDLLTVDVDILVQTKIKSARLAPSGQELKVVPEGGGVRVKLPPIKLWTTIVME